MERIALNADLDLSRIVYGMRRLADDRDTSVVTVTGMLFA